MSAKVLCATLLCLQFADMASSARILALSPLGPRSHIHAFMPFVEELAKRGHNLTVMTAYPPKTNHPNIRKIVLPEMVELIDINWYDFKTHSSFFTSLKVLKFFLDTETVAYQRFMANQNVKEYLKTQELDFIILDGILHEFAMPFVDYFQIPFVTYDHSSGMSWNTWFQGVDRDYAFIPPGLGDIGADMTFFQRLNNMIVGESTMIVRKYYLLSALDKLVKEDFPNARPIAEIERSADLCFMNHHPTTFWNRNFPATVIRTSAMHVRPTQPLPKDLQEFVDEAEHGFIVFTLGSNSRVSDMPEHLRTAFVHAFSRIPQRVLWKWEGEEIPGLSSNVKTVNWLPQQDLLGHEKAKLFIAHGGLLGLQEAIYHAVPVLGLPLGRDQIVLLIKASNEGYAIRMEWENITEDTLYHAIQKLINDPSYKENATRMSKIMRDTFAPSREVGAYWVEYLLRHGSTKHLQTKSKDIPFYQVYMLDAWAFIFAIVVLTYTTAKAAIRMCRRKTNKVKTS